MQLNPIEAIDFIDFLQPELADYCYAKTADGYRLFKTRTKQPLGDFQTFEKLLEAAQWWRSLDPFDCLFF